MNASERRSETLRSIAAIVVFVFLLRLPFLNQAIQGDDVYYLKGAEHALVDPLHPSHATYIFQGDRVDMRGHPHPPLNSWFLAALLTLFKNVREIPFHAAYIGFSLVAALSVFGLARRFCERPLAATILFMVTPAFVINGTSLEADVPFAAFWLAAVACFVYERYALAAFVAMLAALTAYQAIMLVPVLLLYNWRDRRAWIAALAAPVTIAGYQIFERLTSGALPATVLAGYMSTYGLQTLHAKVRNAVALDGHVAWIVCPILAAFAFRRVNKWAVPVLLAVAAAAISYDPNPLFWASITLGAMVLIDCGTHAREFLSAWVIIFFAAALAMFFAGSARYLLPIAAPIAILTARRLETKWLYIGAAASACLSISLAIVNYQHWNAFRELKYDAPRVLTNAEWGLRYYLESAGALPIVKGQAFRPGDLIVASAYETPPQSRMLIPVSSRVITSAIPLRLIALGSKSGYSSAGFGLRPFDISNAPFDRLTIETVTERKPELSVLKIGAPESAAQILSGIYSNDGWTSEKASVLLKRPPNATVVEASFYIPPQAPARTISLYEDIRLLKSETYTGAGLKKLGGPVPIGDPIAITFTVDKTFRAPPDKRELGVLLIEIGVR